MKHVQLGREKNSLEKKTVPGMLLALLVFSILTANMIMVTAQEKHDVAVVSVTPSATLVEKGNVVNITVVVENHGDFTETFNLSCTHDETLIETQTNITLVSGESTNVTFNWNTTGFWDHSSPQEIKATASTVPGETDIVDNTFVSSNRIRVYKSPYVGVVPFSTVNSSLTIGTNYTVSIYTDYNGSDITGWQFSLTYNPNVLAGVSVVNDGILSDALFKPGTFNNVAGELWIASAFYFGAGVVTSGPGKLATITFTVVGLGDSDITLGEDTYLKGWNSTIAKTYNIVSDWEPDPFHLLHGFFQNAEVTHDVAVVSVTVFPTEVVQGEPVTITVVIENQGTVAEDVTVKVYRDYDPDVSAPIETKTVSALAIGENTTVNFTWDTTHVLVGTHTITAVLPELPGETDTDDNTLRSDETVTVLWDAVYIRPNGSIDPPTAPISSVDNVTYTFSGNIYDEIVVERDSIVVDGAGYSVQEVGGTGIYLYGRNNVTIKSMEGVSGFIGIRLKNSSNISVYGNNMTDNGYGIYLIDSSNNTISKNKITSNKYAGIGLFDSSNNSIIENNITNNWYGIYLHGSSGNIIYHNNFVENTFQVETYDSASIWDNEYPSGGNYWSDYEERYPDAEELDDSEIWDTPYFIDENNQDNYPLMEPWSPIPSSPVEATQELIETIETWNLHKGTENSLKAKLKVAIHMLDMGKEDGAIRKLTAFINRVEMLREKTLTNEQADYLIAEAQRIINLING
jgi:parallel beta-helix repeat protein